jgi:conjugative relaxase-like TrwC/TraI family protein
LNGILPSGEGVAQVEHRRAGIDLTFSMPKSASVMAYIAGDKRVLGANLAAVQKTMAWVEKNLAEGRRDVEGRKVPFATGNLVYALFQHDTSRALDPQGHIHAVIANLTRMSDGKWQALHADKIWSNNSVIGAIYHAYFREGLEKLGYTLNLKGKHGTFEIAGVPQRVLDAFSQRREQILEKATALGVKSPEALREITKRSRDPKLDVEDRDGLRQEWVDRAVALGFDGKALAAAAIARSEHGLPENRLGQGFRALTDAIASAREKVGEFLRPSDPLVDRGLARIVQTPASARAQLAVASAVRILGEREAAFPTHQLSKTALDLGLKNVTVGHVEKRIGQLIEHGALLQGTGRACDHVTTLEALRTEEKILTAVEAGKGVAEPILEASATPDRLQAVAERPLNVGQLAAATLIVASPDQTISVQGIAGAGKSTMLQAVARLAESEGRTITGLAFQNKMVADLAEGAGIKAQTIASFVLANERYLTQREGKGYREARGHLEGTMVIVDETSMVSSTDMLKLHGIVDALGIDKLVLVGDRQQLSSIDAGKSFAMIQAGGGTLARMEENMRQRTETLRTVAALANLGKASDAIRVLGDKVIEAPAPAEHAAYLWLGLSEEERSVTAVFASGREARATINQRIQDGLASEGTLTGQGIHLTVYDRVNTTREELRYSSTYRAGQTLEVGRGGAEDVGLKGGRYDVVGVTARCKVELQNGRRRIQLDPQRLSPLEERDRLQLSVKKDVHLREGDRIRWTANDKPRGLHNAALARVVGIDAKGVTVDLGENQRLTLPMGDPMLSRLDLAYALNMHMAQGITTDKAITVMDSKERNLANQRLFNVGVTRVRDDLTLVVDNKARLQVQLDHNPGNKTSALETMGRLDIDKAVAGRTSNVDLSTLDKIDLGDLLPPSGDLPPLPARPGAEPVAHKTEDLGAPQLKPDAELPLPLLPERTLGLDL